MNFQKNQLYNPLKSFRSLNKFNLDLTWNIAGFVITGIISISINILIIGYYDSASLGVFNIVYAIYILLSQLASGGIHLSVQKHIPQYSDDKKKTDIIIISAILITVIVTLLLTSIAYLLRDIPGEVFHNSGVTSGFTLVIPGLIFFSLNKVLLSFLNGYRKMKAYAFFLMMRSVLMIVILIILIMLNASGFMIPVILSGAEIILFLILVIYTGRFWNILFTKELSYWIKGHIRFGSKAVVGNVLLDVNSRVDVLVLGLYSSESVVGIYSFASSLSDGFTQLPYVLRTNINPVLTKCYFTKGKFVLERIMERSKKIFNRLLIPAGILCVLCFPVLVNIFGFQEKLSGGWTVFIVLMSGIIVSARYLPYQMIFNQLGFPGIQSLFLFLFFITNLVLNFIFAPIWGMYGSAIAVSLSFIAQAIYLKLLLWKKINIRI